ncbi:ferritin-like domain-containing protein [bacterium]|nr:ferritin-like domain-containing protein [bacterium]
MNAPKLDCSSLSAAAVSVLECADADDKSALAQQLAEAWCDGAISIVGLAPAPDRPARPARPALLAPREMPKRGKAGSPTGRIALLHALAHIELNAVDLACDIIARFSALDLPRHYYDDWVKVVSEEGLHFSLLAKRLRELNSFYGDFPGHDGLWEAAQETAHDLLARLAIVPLVLEARGLDVTPTMINNLRKAGDIPSTEILERIYNDEIGHVAIGHRWFLHICDERDVAPEATWQGLVKKHFKGALKPPFNDEARQLAGVPLSYYTPEPD